MGWCVVWCLFGWGGGLGFCVWCGCWVVVVWLCGVFCFCVLGWVCVVWVVCVWLVWVLLLCGFGLVGGRVVWFLGRGCCGVWGVIWWLFVLVVGGVVVGVVVWLVLIFGVWLGGSCWFLCWCLVWCGGLGVGWVGGVGGGLLWGCGGFWLCGLIVWGCGVGGILCLVGGCMFVGLGLGGVVGVVYCWGVLVGGFWWVGVGFVCGWGDGGGGFLVWCIVWMKSVGDFWGVVFLVGDGCVRVVWGLGCLRWCFWFCCGMWFLGLWVVLVWGGGVRGMMGVIVWGCGGGLGRRGDGDMLMWFVGGWVYVGGGCNVLGWWVWGFVGFGYVLVFMSWVGELCGCVGRVGVGVIWFWLVRFSVVRRGGGLVGGVVCEVVFVGRVGFGCFFGFCVWGSSGCCCVWGFVRVGCCMFVWLLFGMCGFVFGGVGWGLVGIRCCELLGGGCGFVVWWGCVVELVMVVLCCGMVWGVWVGWGVFGWRGVLGIGRGNGVGGWGGGLGGVGGWGGVCGVGIGVGLKDEWGVMGWVGLEMERIGRV
uniref:Uncharacterized protein n=1 Tax=Knipowitschia caucasica TaxID=637954 RepID=A0AAV2JY27_KNICA